MWIKFSALAFEMLAAQVIYKKTLTIVNCKLQFSLDYKFLFYLLCKIYKVCATYGYDIVSHPL